MAKTHRFLIAALAAALLTAGPASAGVVDLNGAFSVLVLKPLFVPCPPGEECGVMELAGLGKADWTYVFGPTFDPDPTQRRCFDVDGTFSITLHSDGSTISGPLTGVFCPRPSGTGHEHAGTISWGNPFYEDDTIHFSGGTGQFAGLQGTATFHQNAAGAVFQGSLTGELSN